MDARQYIERLETDASISEVNGPGSTLVRFFATVLDNERWHQCSRGDLGCRMATNR
jgi:hypothetical protein